MWKWPVGQAVKTAASHAANVGSIPARVTKILTVPKRNRTREGLSVGFLPVAEIQRRVVKRESASRQDAKHPVDSRTGHQELFPARVKSTEVSEAGRRFRTLKVGTDYGEGTPVPIPNTEVKLTCAEDTWLVTARDNRWRQHRYSSLAQLVEHAAVNRRVVGSSPTRGARKRSVHL